MMAWSVTSNEGPGGTSGSAGTGARASCFFCQRSSQENRNGLAMIDSSEPARIRSRPSGGRIFSDTPSAARMKENSPICARLTEMVRAVPAGCLNARTMKNAASDLPTTMMPNVASTCHGCAIRMAGLNSMPTETKNSTAKASRNGRESLAALWLSSDSLSSMPAKNAPSAKDTPNSVAEPNATPSAMARTDRVNSSREPVAAIFSRVQGITRRPTSSMKATNAPSLTSVQAMATTKRPKLAGSSPVALPKVSASTGSITSASTMAMSSTISQPTAMRPRRVSSSRRSSIARNSTTVLATDSARPNTKPLSGVQPMPQASAQPRPVATAICAMAPGIAIALTSSRSSSEKCRPTPNISSITPSSDSWLASSWSATKPGVNGPTKTPASR